VIALNGGERRPIAAFAGQCVRAIAAIGHPARFFAMLREQGLIVDGRELPDHAAIPPGALASRSGQSVLMTEKDAVKCGGSGLRDAWYVEVDARLDEASATTLIDRILRMARDQDLGA
jgi:tetraacyldisaccharide 4'-kinase